METNYTPLTVVEKQGGIILGYGNLITGEPGVHNLVHLQGEIPGEGVYDCTIPVPKNVLDYVRVGEEVVIPLHQRGEEWTHKNEEVTSLLGGKGV